MLPAGSTHAGGSVAPAERLQPLFVRFAMLGFLNAAKHSSVMKKQL